MNGHRNSFILTILISVIAASVAGFLSGGIAFSYLNDMDADFGFQEKGSVREVNVSAEESAIIDAVESSRDSVVSITISREIDRPVRSPFELFFRSPKNPEEREVGGGTGFIVSEDGTIVTNKHVVRDTEATYRVRLRNGDEVEGEVVSRHPNQDLAVMKIDYEGELNALSLGNSEEIQVGQTAIAIGNALTEFDNTVSKGIISGLGRTITASDGRRNREQLSNLLQTDAAINPGNSGGPLLDINGNVIGVNVAVAKEAQNIGFAIPANVVRNMLQDIEEFGEIQVPFLGVRYQMLSIDSQLQEEIGRNTGAWIVEGSGNSILSDSPADEADLEEGDVIVSIEGQNLNINNTLADAVAEYRPGDTVSLEIWRDGDTFSQDVTLDQIPDNL